MGGCLGNGERERDGYVHCLIVEMGLWYVCVYIYIYEIVCFKWVQFIIRQFSLNSAININ